MKKFFITFLMVIQAMLLYSQTDTEFWFAAPEVTSQHEESPILLRISSFDQPCEVTISQPANPGFSAITISLDATSHQSIDLTPWIDIIENKPFNQVLNYGLNISSTAPITAYYEVNAPFNPELFALKGKNALGKEFFIATQNLLYNDEYLDAHSGFILVATEDNTTVRINPSHEIVGHPANIEFLITLNKGQTYAAIAANSEAEEHLCGSHVKSDKPIAITMYDDSMNGTVVFGGCQDLGGDQLIPVSKIGLEYIAVRGSLSFPYDQLFILATDDNTEIYVNENFISEINSGETVRYGMGSDGAAYIKATRPVYVLHMTGNGCEVGLALLPHIECNGSEEISITRSADSQFWITLITKSGSEDDFFLDGNSGSINATDFSIVPGSGGEWVFTHLNISTGTILPDQTFRISNSTGKFHMGIIHGTNYGCRYGFFSDYAQLEFIVSSNKENFCEGETLQLSANFLPGVNYHWKGPNGFSQTGQSIEIQALTHDQTGFYSLTGTTGFCDVRPDSIFITVNPSPADIGEQSNNTEVNINNGLIAYYPFDGNVNDYSGNGNHGINHGATGAEDRCGNANSSMFFNGVDDWIEVPNSPSLQSPDSALSISTWIRSQNPIIYFICKVTGPSWNSYQYRTGMNLEINSFYLGIDEFDYVYFQDAQIALNEWFYFTVTYNATYVTFYINGQVKISVPLDQIITPNEERLEIGRDSHGPTEWLLGELDELRLYNRALTDEEVSLLYHQNCYPVYLEGSLAPNSVCRGENASLEIINAQAGVSYQLLKDGMPYGTARIGNLDTLNFSLNNLQETGSFTVEATDTASGCSIVLDTTFTVSVLSPNVTATAVPDDEYAPATVSLGSNSSDASSFEWFLDGSSIATTEQAEIQLGEPGNYSFVLVASSGPPANCTVMDTVVVELKESIDVVMDIPNAFTPNGDGINDYFEIYTEGINSSDVWVKDKWGLLIKEFDGQNDKWDGNTTSGREAPDGPYYFHVKATDYRDRPMEESGIVYLFRDLIDLTPNPASQKIMIRMNGRLPGERTACISSIDGISLFEDKFSGEMLEADVSMLKPGLYFIRICNGKDQQYLKFIKE